jgi:hypothetical protein
MNSEFHYSDIYDFDSHEPRWDSVDKIWRYYEGYGQGKCPEKMLYRTSINLDHPLWSSGGADKDGNPVGTHSSSKKLMFNEKAVVVTVGEEGVNTEKIDCLDRHDRTSWNFALMLVEFVEKCPQRNRMSFFKSGGGGEKWTKNIEMMKDFKRIFDWMDRMLVCDKTKKIALSDQTIKDYPRHFYEQIASLYETYMGELLGVNWWVEKKVEKKKFKFNPNATVFVPSVIYGEACQKESPPKPEGVAPGKFRPISTSKGDSMMAWNLYEETDIKLVEIERKLQALINLQGPVVHAQQI